MDWDRAEKEWIGAVVLVGLTYVTQEDEFDYQVQFYGQITYIQRDWGIQLSLSGQRAGEVYDLPPQLEAFKPAPAGEYRLRSTGEVVIDPDFTTSWTIKPPLNA